MALIAELTLSGGLPSFSDLFVERPEATCRFEDVHYLVQEDGAVSYVFFWWMRGCAPSAFERALEAEPTTTDFRRLAEAIDATMYRVETVRFPPDQPLVFPLFRENDITWLDARRDAAGLHLRARCPTHDALMAFNTASTAVADRCRVTRLYEDGPASVGTDLLTDRQREALLLAYERGYFASPRRVTLETLATEFDITAQTLSRHLRRAVETIVGAAIRGAELGRP